MLACRVEDVSRFVPSRWKWLDDGKKTAYIGDAYIEDCLIVLLFSDIQHSK
jgi:hypothetical protein